MGHQGLSGVVGCGVVQPGSFLRSTGLFPATMIQDGSVLPCGRSRPMPKKQPGNVVTIAVTITPAAACEWAVAVDLVFQHLPAEERLQRRANTLAMLDSGEITSAEHPGGPARRDSMVGAMVCVAAQGGQRPVLAAAGAPRRGWRPRCRFSGTAWAGLAGALRGAKIAQAIIPAAEYAPAAPLLQLRLPSHHPSAVFFIQPSQADHRLYTNPIQRVEFRFLRNLSARQSAYSFTKLSSGLTKARSIAPSSTADAPWRRSLPGIESQGQFRPELWCLALQAGPAGGRGHAGRRR